MTRRDRTKYGNHRDVGPVSTHESEGVGLAKQRASVLQDAVDVRQLFSSVRHHGSVPVKAFEIPEVLVEGRVAAFAAPGSKSAAGYRQDAPLDDAAAGFVEARLTVTWYTAPVSATRSASRDCPRYLRGTP